ncbi:hypothetical protein OCU04_000765 [Sclerotinia nivalis]|uniref:Uncharacterized protein n=1 Tax=Sclerotinia nivalis TaxID=352851 RepID=A0A9X0AXU9_9HELO|nr:hypothetical protein OCU04_000765 [Sclerotinia nivalis]
MSTDRPPNRSEFHAEGDESQNPETIAKVLSTFLARFQRLSRLPMPSVLADPDRSVMGAVIDPAHIS